MALSEQRVKGYIKRLLLSRMRILCKHGFYGLLLMHMLFSIDEQLETAATDGTRIIFGAQFLDGLSDGELDFVLMHEILHIVLQHCSRSEAHDSEAFNIACDIVVNSNILLENDGQISSIALNGYGVPVHTAPNGREGFEYTAEQIYAMLSKSPSKQPKNGCDGRSAEQEKHEFANDNPKQARQWDDHSRWCTFEEDPALRDAWLKRLADAAEAMEARDPSGARGLVPNFAQRLLKNLRKPQTDWKTVLNDFIQEDIVDYSLVPPDRRFEDTPFFLPDFNAREEAVKDILFMIDTSGSVSVDMVTAAYSEIKGAIDQFDGKLKGWLGFFDAAVIEPRPFTDEVEFGKIKAVGGGGTDFLIIFEYIIAHMKDEPPASLVILTDGYAPFPRENPIQDLPVLWLVNNNNIEPPWGKTARIEV